MKASFVDLRRKSAEILRALDRNESVTLFYRGKPKGIIQPVVAEKSAADLRKHPAFGMWADREDMKDPAQWVRNLRKRRRYGL